ncbi:MAG TPA: transposase, partial [Clostridiales bacterium]|nr:transposase [Clostridiales bacterium]
LLKRYKDKYHCSIYSYILMDTHVHIYINTCGADISSFMRSLNIAYVRYYNKKYQRHGHLFGGRFASFIVDNNTYSLTLSAYINNNAKDLPGYSGKEELYPYSSYGIYTGYRDELDGIVDTDFILKCFSSDKKVAREKYRAFTESMKNKDIINEVDGNITGAYTENKYKSEKSYIVRSENPDEVLGKIEKLLGEKLSEGFSEELPGELQAELAVGFSERPSVGLPTSLSRELHVGLSLGISTDLRLKHNREVVKIRAFATYILRTLCGYTYKQLCQYIGNMSLSGISRLVNEGFKLLKEHVVFRDVFNAIIKTG